MRRTGSREPLPLTAGSSIGEVHDRAMGRPAGCKSRPENRAYCGPTNPVRSIGRSLAAILRPLPSNEKTYRRQSIREGRRQGGGGAGARPFSGYAGRQRCPRLLCHFNAGRQPDQESGLRPKRSRYPYFTLSSTAAWRIRNYGRTFLPPGRTDAATTASRCRILVGVASATRGHPAGGSGRWGGGRPRARSGSDGAA